MLVIIIGMPFMTTSAGGSSVEVEVSSFDTVQCKTSQHAASARRSEQYLAKFFFENPCATSKLLGQ